MSEPSSPNVQLLATETRYEGFFKILALKVKHTLFGGGWSPVITRELFERGSAAAALLYDPHNDLLAMIEQFRVGALMGGAKSPWCFEVVAGMIDEGETPEQSIRRELLEEANFEPSDLPLICSYLSSPGGSSERIHLYCALGDLTNAGGIFGLAGESEDIKVHVLPAEQVLSQLYSDEYCNAATLIALQWLQANRERLRQAALK